jgi:esterase/lipase superfamily enzyme
MLRWVVIFLILAVAGVVAVSFYQPPMRLMPAPTIFHDGQTNVFDADPAHAREPDIKLFYATNRLAVGPLDNRIYAIVPGRDLHLGQATIRIGEEGTTWDKIYAWSTGASDDRRPFLHLDNLNETATVEPGQSLTPDAAAWFRSIDEARLSGPDTDVIVYVHGANTTMERAAGQAAQLHHFTGRNSVVVLFAWPTAENFLWYPRDMVTAFGAAPQLVKLIELLSEHTEASKIDVFTYSAGGTVGSSALAMAGQHAKGPQPPPLRLGEVYHAAPDADFSTFVAEMRDYASLARRVTVSANLNDSALRLSQIINRASRAGRPDMRELDAEETNWLLEGAGTMDVEVLKVRPENIPGLSRGSHTFWYEDPWVSSDVLITLLYHLDPGTRGLHPDVTPSGVPYWTFTPDYPEQLARVMEQLRAQGRAEAPD